jgi:hypothetical protein
MTANLISPELVLVCPDLRDAAIAALPHREPDAWLDRSTTLASPSSEFDLVASLASEEAHVVEPATTVAIPPSEFGLVAAAASQETPVESLIRSKPMAIPPSEFALMAALASEEAPVEERATPLAVALVAYTAASATRFTIEATAFVVIVIGLVSAATLFHS